MGGVGSGDALGCGDALGSGVDVGVAEGSGALVGSEPVAWLGTRRNGGFGASTWDALASPFVVIGATGSG